MNIDYIHKDETFYCTVGLRNRHGFYSLWGRRRNFMYNLFESRWKWRLLYYTHALSVTFSPYFPLQLTELINYKPTLEHSCLFCNVFFEGWQRYSVKQKREETQKHTTEPVTSGCVTMPDVYVDFEVIPESVCVSLFKRIQETLRLLCSRWGPANCYGTSEDLIYLPDGTVGRVNLNLSGSRRRTWLGF